MRLLKGGNGDQRRKPGPEDMAEGKKRRATSAGGPGAARRNGDARAGAEQWRNRIRLLYEGRSKRAKRFRYAMLAFDLFTIAFFVLASFVHEAPWLRGIELALSVLIAADFLIRLWIAREKRKYLLQLATVADVIVVISLLVQIFVENLAFLRILRALRLMRSYHVIKDLRARWSFFRRNERVIVASVNMTVFVFVVTATVYTVQASFNPAINNYVDALYYTVTTLTTVGYGDITLTGVSGKLLSVIIMIFGVALFLQLVQAIFRPRKVRFRCPRCGLREHDPDASHCKACGHVLNIPYEG